MELTVDREELRARRLFVGVPMYGGQCYAEFAYAIARLTLLCSELGISLRLHFHCNNSLVMRARNAIVDEFLASGDTHLLFIDADIGFDPQDVIYLLALQDPDASSDEYDVVAVAAPLRQVAWDNVARAVKMGVADVDPSILEKYAGRMVAAPLGGGALPLGKPAEVDAAGTGFMMVRRATFERVRVANPGLAFAPDNQPAVPGQAPEGFAWFDTAIDSKASNLAEELTLFLRERPGATGDEIAAFLANPAASMKRYTDRFVSEDYMFCRRVRDAGMKVWICPWMQLTHSGNYTFTASLSHVGTLRADG